MPGIKKLAMALEGVRTGNLAMPDFANVVRSIGVNQMKNGGFNDFGRNNPTPIPVAPSGDNDAMMKMMAKILYYLENPKPGVALFDYDYFQDETEYMDKIKDMARG
jgi:hypothetical protein